MGSFDYTMKRSVEDEIAVKRDEIARSLAFLSEELQCEGAPEFFIQAAAILKTVEGALRMPESVRGLAVACQIFTQMFTAAKLAELKARESSFETDEGPEAASKGVPFL